MGGPDSLRKSPLFDFLNRRDDVAFEDFPGKLNEDEDYIDWNGVLMPMDYGDAKAEYFAIRNECALCDVSPMRKIRVSGSGSGKFLDHLVTRPVSKLPKMRAAYTVFCNDDGSVKDDAIVYKFSDDDYLVLPSDVDHRPYFESVCARFDIKDVAFDDCTDEWLGIAIQGPESASAIVSMGFDGADQLKPFEIRSYDIDNQTVHVARVGFTADLGYECWFESSLADAVMQRVETARKAIDLCIPGYALTALQVCRMEGGFIVAGWDFSTEIEPQPGFERSPYELGLGWLVDLNGGDFVGRAALAQQQVNDASHVLRYFSNDAALQVNDGTDVFADAGATGNSIGLITCSIWSWGLQRTIGNVSLRSGYDHVDAVWVRSSGSPVELTINRRPTLDLSRRHENPAPVREPLGRVPNDTFPSVG